MPKSKIFSIKGEFGVWQVQAINRDKAIERLHKFFAKQEGKEAKVVLREICAIDQAAPIPKEFF
jgi:hypothetical protein